VANDCHVCAGPSSAVVQAFSPTSVVAGTAVDVFGFDMYPVKGMPAAFAPPGQCGNTTGVYRVGHERKVFLHVAYLDPPFLACGFAGS
jgi:hypothetical protein